MKKHMTSHYTQVRATRPRLQPRHSRSRMKWMIITVFCVALTVFLIAIASAAQARGGSLAGMQKQQQLANVERSDLYAKSVNQNQMPSIQPAPVRHAGIGTMHQGPFLSSVFTVHNVWQGPVGSGWVLAYAGAKPNADGTAGPGGIVLYTETVNALGGFDLHPLGTFLAPNGCTALSVTAVKGNLMTLRSDTGRALTFNLPTHQFQ